MSAGALQRSPRSLDPLAGFKGQLRGRGEWRGGERRTRGRD